MNKSNAERGPRANDIEETVKIIFIIKMNQLNIEKFNINWTLNFYSG
jgi:hypothetical protein